MGVIQLGPIGIGNAPVPAGASDAQFGFALPADTTTFISPTTIAPSAGAVLAAPVPIPGGLLGLICPSNDPVIGQVCDALTENGLNDVTATLESAGSPTNFNVFASLETGVVIVTLPVKVKLTNPLLGSTCATSAASSNPILLNPQNSVAGAGDNGDYDLNGNPDPAGSSGNHHRHRLDRGGYHVLGPRRRMAATC